MVGIQAQVPWWVYRLRYHGGYNGYPIVEECGYNGYPIVEECGYSGLPELTPEESDAAQSPLEAGLIPIILLFLTQFLTFSPPSSTIG